MIMQYWCILGNGTDTHVITYVVILLLLIHTARNPRGLINWSSIS